MLLEHYHSQKAAHATIMCVCVCVSLQLLQFKNVGHFTVGATARPCAQIHHSLKEKQQRKVLYLVYLSFSMTQHKFIWILNPLRVRLNEFIVYAPGQEFSNHFHSCAVLQSGSKQRIVRRDSSLHVELGELTTEVDLDIVGRLESIIQALSHCPSQPKKPANTQVLLWHSAWFMICTWLLHYITSFSDM